MRLSYAWQSGFVVSLLLFVSSCKPCKGVIECATFDLNEHCVEEGTCQTDPPTQPNCSGACEVGYFAISEADQSWTYSLVGLPEEADDKRVLRVRLDSGATVTGEVSISLDGKPPASCSAILETPADETAAPTEWRCKLEELPRVVEISMTASTAAVRAEVDLVEELCTQKREVCPD